MSAQLIESRKHGGQGEALIALEQMYRRVRYADQHHANLHK